MDINNISLDDVINEFEMTKPKIFYGKSYKNIILN